MSFWFLLQLLVNVILLAGIVGMWVRLNRPPKDDPRLSKGLQLLQSKIAVLEDLSDRTETQVNQLTALLEQKVKDIQAKIQASEKQIAKIDQSMQKSLEVAKIFQDRIPHNEIVERQNTIKYVKAARMAHQGADIEEIAAQCPELSRGEIEFIAKVNRDQLMFCEESLPEWAAHTDEETAMTDSSDLSDVDNISFGAPLQREKTSDISSIFEVPRNENDQLKKLGEAFKAACLEVEEEEKKAEQKAPSIMNVTQDIAQNFLGEKPAQQKHIPKKNIGEPVIRPVEFRRIDLSRDLG
ncbi:DUF2802 domain-containing protein [Bdellovibrio sp. NC01]|uniref:DUF2802 domain-containing protein n=1 Tax=Bdellovibrio sp. NC01 TaxID=2220073 RepID=UPI001FEDBEC9|nr:DUF2802 domain-containing protein [Bdellovibrio sp. NC01]